MKSDTSQLFPKPKRKRPERRDQMNLVSYASAKYPGINTIVCPIVYYGGDAKQRAIQGGMMKKMGYKKGTPDVFFAVARAGYHGLFMELKNETDGEESPDQLRMMLCLTQERYLCYFVYGHQAACKCLDAYMAGTPL